MDSLKIPKAGSNVASSGGSSSKPSSSVPITVRFNAGEECIDDLFQSFQNNSNSGGGGGGGGGGGSSGNSGGGDSLSSSPSQQHHHHHHQAQSQSNTDEVNTRNNFLQGNFFNRKRSGSIEGISPTLSGPNLTAALSNTDANSSVGTWKLFKGRVSQKIEDIKSAKSEKNHSTSNTLSVHKGETSQSNDPDSDQDNASFNTSLSEELPLSEHHKGADSDSDFDNEILFEGEGETSRLRRGLAHLKSRVKAKAATHHLHHHNRSRHLASIPTVIASTTPVDPKVSISNMKKDETSPSRKGNFLRKRRPTEVNEHDPATSAESIAVPVPVPVASTSKTAPKPKNKGIKRGKKEIEIESGVEMLEDMIPADQQKENEHSSKQKRVMMDLPLEPVLPTATDSKTNLHNENAIDTEQIEIQRPYIRSRMNSLGRHSTILRPLFTKLTLLLALALLLVLWLPIPDFLRGIFACLLSIAFLESIWSVIQHVLEIFIVKIRPEKNDFEIPDYTKMSILQMPVIEEHRNLKAYSGWMNEVNSYDPDTFHISMTTSVYVKMEGTSMRLYATNARIPKKVMWNEPTIDRKAISFTSIRSYDLTDCRIEMLPLGLARKRYFNRKYPIHLIIKNCKEAVESLRPSDPEINGEPSTTLETNSNNLKEGKKVDEHGEKNGAQDVEIDFASTVLNSNLQTLFEGDDVEPRKNASVPCGDEVRLILFSRGDREKEDWYRRFEAASRGAVYDQELRIPNMRVVTDYDLQLAAAKAALQLTAVPDLLPAQTAADTNDDGNETNTPAGQKETETPDVDLDFLEELELLGDDVNIEGLIMSADSARNPEDYIRFMALYQKACNQTRIPVYKKFAEENNDLSRNNKKRHRRQRRQADELWKGIDQSLFLGPSGSVVWTNVLIGRILFSCLNNVDVQLKIQEVLQKKLSSIKLPAFIEAVIITNMNLGNTPPLFHRFSQPMLDERGTWIDTDMTYEGLLNFTITTKLNLLRMKKPVRGADDPNNTTNPTTFTAQDDAAAQDDTQELQETISGSAIFYSDAESSGGSSSDEESPVTTEAPAGNEFSVFNTTPGNARRIFRIMDRIATSNFFQYATDLPYVQRAMENMSANITLKVEVRGLVGRGMINIPPPPSDRIWVGFRAPPRLWIVAKPTVGDKSIDWSIVTNVIESKILEMVNRFLIYPNMVDFTIPLLGSSTYKEA